MTQNKLWGLIAIINIVFLILPSPASAEEAELSFFKNKYRKQAQMPYSPAPPNRAGIKVGLRLMGGGFMLMKNDINDHLQGYNDYFNDIPGSTVKSEFEPIKTGMDFSGEILISFNPYLGIGIGSGYISAGKESTLESHFPQNAFEGNAYPQFSAIPVTLSLYFGIPVGPALKIMFNAGGGYYLGKIDWEYYQIGSMNDRYEETWSAKPEALGFHGGIHFEFEFTRNSAFVIGAKARSVKFKDISGNLEWEFTSPFGNSSGSEENAKLWYGTWETWLTANKYPGIIISENPSAYGWEKEREGEVNLSGIIFQAGLKIYF